MRRMHVSLLAVIAVGTFGLAAASAGVNNWEACWVDAGPLSVAQSDWTLDPIAGSWDIRENYVSPTVGTATVGLNGWVTSPLRDGYTISVSKTVTNNSSFDWAGYEVVVSGTPGVALIESSVTSTVFTDITVVGDTITLGSPGTVGIGEQFTVAFDIAVPDGQFTFDIAQTPMPVPEPATALVLALGGLVLRRR